MTSDLSQPEDSTVRAVKQSVKFPILGVEGVVIGLSEGVLDAILSTASAHNQVGTAAVGIVRIDEEGNPLGGMHIITSSTENADGSLSMKRDPGTRSDDDPGAFVAAIALQKVSYCLLTGEPSGSIDASMPVPTGMTPFRGGLPTDHNQGYRVAAAFSGAPEETDLKIVIESDALNLLFQHIGEALGIWKQLEGISASLLQKTDRDNNPDDDAGDVQQRVMPGR